MEKLKMSSHKYWIPSVRMQHSDNFALSIPTWHKA